tara:strand:+ start:279 stop:734 length:456 start_codon:yes stop_codon:yes gene_type:complete
MSKIELQEITLKIAIENWEKIKYLLGQLKSQPVNHINRLSIYNYFSYEIANNKNQPIFFIRDKESNIIGIIKIILEKKILRDFMRVAHVEDFVIDNNYRGLGYGKSTLKAIKKYCRARDCYKIILNCDKNVQKFYQKCDFNHTNSEMSYYF